MIIIGRELRGSSDDVEKDKSLSNIFCFYNLEIQYSLITRVWDVPQF